MRRSSIAVVGVVALLGGIIAMGTTNAPDPTAFFARGWRLAHDAIHVVLAPSLRRFITNLPRRVELINISTTAAARKNSSTRAPAQQQAQIATTLSKSRMAPSDASMVIPGGSEYSSAHQQAQSPAPTWPVWPQEFPAGIPIPRRSIHRAATCAQHAADADRAMR